MCASFEQFPPSLYPSLCWPMADIAAHVGCAEREEKMPVTFPLLTAALFLRRAFLKESFRVCVHNSDMGVCVCNCSALWDDPNVGVPVVSPGIRQVKEAGMKRVL